MTDDLPISPFVRQRKGARNEYLFRSDNDHAERSVKAILRRDPPAWSSMRCGFEVAA